MAEATGQEPPKPEAEAGAEAAKPNEDEPGADGKAKEAAAEDDGVLSQGDKTEAEKAAEAAKVPEKLTDRPEWQAAVKIADKLGKTAGVEMRGIMRGMFKREFELTQQVKQLAPAREVVSEIYQSVGGTEQGFTNIRNLIKNYDAAPEEAIPMLKLLLDDAEKRAGLVLQAPELLTEAQAVDKQLADGVIDQAAADKRKSELVELQKARTGVDRTKQRSETDRLKREQQQTQARQHAAVAEIQAAATAWEKEKLAKDPDFLPLKSLHTDRCMQLATAEVQRLGRMLTGKEARGVADEALKQVKAEVGKLLPARKERKVISGGDGSSGNKRTVPTSEFEEFQQTVAQATGRH